MRLKPAFSYKGRAEDALATMANYRVNLAPLRYGAGLKGKVFDGFQTGTPSVLTPIAAEGIVGAMDWGCSVSDDPLEFATAAIETYTKCRDMDACAATRSSDCPSTLRCGPVAGAPTAAVRDSNGAVGHQSSSALHRAHVAPPSSPEHRVYEPLDRGEESVREI